jgi:hypothetical protein
MRSTWDRLTAVSTYGPPGSEEDDEPDYGWDFSGLGNPSAMRDFMIACDYCLFDCSDSSHSLGDEDYGPSRECFHVDLGGLDEGNHLGMPEDSDPPRPAPRVDILRELVVVPVPVGGGGSGRTARANPRGTGQARRGSRTTCPASAKYWAGVGRPSTGQRSASSGPGRQAPHRRRCQGKAAPGFQWGRPEPGCSSNTTPSDAGTIHHRGRRIQGELKNLLEDAAVRRAESSASRRQGYAPEPRSTPGAHGTRHLRPRVTSATSTTAATVKPTSTIRCAEATTPGVGDATTAGRIGAPRPNHPVRRLSAGPYDGRRSRPGSEPRLPSPSTRGRQGRNYGSWTTGWSASWVEWTMTTSSSATSPCSSPTLPKPGWSICLLRRSLTRTTWSKLSPATSRAHTCALGTPGIFEAAASSRENPSGTTSDDFRSSAPSCPTSLTRMSSARSSPAPLAATW